jgi:Ran-binding protein 1
MSALDDTKPEVVEPAAPAAEPATEPAEAAADGGEGEGGEADAEAESTAVFKPLVNLDEVEVFSGEEAEDTLTTLRGKLYRYTETLLDKGSGKKQWIERGVGEIKLLK